MEEKIKLFTDLYAWQAGHMVVLSIYKITRGVPKKEQFGLTNQIRRAAVSITSNIAEGFSRTSYKEKTQFYAIALGSLTEVQNQLLIAKDILYISQENFTIISSETIKTSKLINGLIKHSKTLIHTS
ncbi:MAG: four helix bundle protein [bacterium]|nr:four helix bundle protein [bacterium]